MHLVDSAIRKTRLFSIEMYSIFCIGFRLERKLEILDKDQPGNSIGVGTHHSTSVNRLDESRTTLRAGTMDSDQSTDTFETARSTLSESWEREKERSRDIAGVDTLRMSKAIPCTDTKSLESNLPNEESSQILDQAEVQVDIRSDPVPTLSSESQSDAPLIEPAVTKQGRRSRLTMLASMCPCCSIS